MEGANFSSRILPGYLRFLVWTMLYLLTVFLGFRLLFYYSFYEGGDFDVHVRGALGIGMHIDLMVSAYVLLLPFLLWSFKFLFKRTSRWIDRIAIALLVITMCISIALACADIPYYQFFKSRITTSVFLWVNDLDQSFRFLVHEKAFYPFYLLFIGVGGISFFYLRYFYHETIGREAIPFGRTHRALIFLAACAVYLFALRGAQTYRSIGIRTAFFTNDPFINHLALNPVLTFFDSFSEFQFRIFPDDLAIDLAAAELNAPGPTGRFYSPIAREVINDPVHPPPNIVLVMMEGMNAGLLRSFGNEKNLMPFTDSLMNESLHFRSFYSSGIHTCNAIYGSLYGMPSIFSRHPMANVKSSGLTFYGMPQVLRENGYHTSFICSHHQEFDNLGYFLPRNGIDELISLKDFPPELYENIWGVNDEALFDRATRMMDSLSDAGKPFFTSILTISTHPPLACPRKTTFRPNSKSAFDQVYEYADFAIRRFMNDARDKPWYRNTLFAFVGDHGVNRSSRLEAPLALNHVPFFIFMPGRPDSHASMSLGMQTDIFPTLMNLSGLNYTNNTLGVDLNRDSRPYAYFSQDKRLCVINHVYYLVIDKSETEIMYKLENGGSTNYIDSKSALADSMKTYAFSMLQTAQFLIDNDLVGKP